MAPFLCMTRPLILAAGVALTIAAAPAAVALSSTTANTAPHMDAAPAKCITLQPTDAFSLTCAPVAPIATGAPSEQTITDTNPGLLSPSHGGAFGRHPL
jgi:hypothetical protein